MTAEFTVPKTARLFALALVVALYACHPAPAETHGWGNPSAYYDDEEYGSFFAPGPIEVPKVTKEDAYEVPPAKVEGNPLGTPLSLTVVDRAPHHYADIVFHNELVPAIRTHANVHFVRPDGNVIMVVFEMGDGDAPDLFMVLPPPGYVAIPAEMSVEEGETGIIEIHEATVG